MERPTGEKGITASCQPAGSACILSASEGNSTRLEEVGSRRKVFPRERISEACQLCRTSAEALRTLIKAKPWVIFVPLLLLVLLVVAGELGVLFAARQFSDQRHQLANGVAVGTAQELALQLQSMLAPNVALGAIVKAQPYVPTLAQSFSVISDNILKKLDPDGSAWRIALGGWGVAFGTAPIKPANVAVMNYHFFEDPLRATVHINGVQQGPDYMDIIGPARLLEARDGFICRSVIFLPNVSADETFGNNVTFTVPYAPGVILGNNTPPEQTACGAACAPVYRDGVLYRFWGFTYSLITVEPITSRLAALEKQSVPYKYVLLRKVDNALNNPVFKAAADFLGNATDKVVFASPASLGPAITDDDSPQCADVQVFGVNMIWTLCIVPLDGWDPTWLLPLQIMIVVTAFLVTGLLFGMLVSQERHSVLVRLMLPRKVIRYLNLGRTYAEPFQQVTILFSDIVSYTNMSSEMTPRELVDLLNDLYSHFDDLVDKHGLYKVETIGDAFMCVGGAPEARDPRDAATRVTRMALDMVKFARNWVRVDGRSIQIRIGLFTGNVTAAVVGRKMPHWCLVGDAVNVASRMESHSLPMHVHVGHTTAELLACNPEFSLQPRGEIEVKGKGRMRTCFVWDAKDGQAKVAVNGSLRMASKRAPSFTLHGTDGSTLDTCLASSPSKPMSIDETSEQENFQDMAA